MMSHSRTTAVAGIAIAAVLLAGCQNGKTVGAPGATGPVSAPTTGATSTAGGGADPGAGPMSTASIRIANFFSTAAQASPALDIYDVALQGQAAQPILTNVAYGTVSDYVPVHQLANGASKQVQLTALPAGENPMTQHGDSSSVGGLVDDGSGYQATIVLTSSNDTAEATGTSLIGILSSSVRVEKGDDGQGLKGPAAPAVTDGSGELLVDDASIASNLHPTLFLMIDASCKAPLNGDPLEPGVPLVFASASAPPLSLFAEFATTAGTHKVSVVSWGPSTAPTCAQLTQLQGTTSVQVAANQQVAIYVYGNALDALHFAVAPIR